MPRFFVTKLDGEDLRYLMKGVDTLRGVVGDGSIIAYATSEDNAKEIVDALIAHNLGLNYLSREAVLDQEVEGTIYAADDPRGSWNLPK